MNSSEKTRFDALTGLRWFAALAVIFRHNRPPGDSMFSTFFENGYSGVTVFFVLSGFVLTVRYFNEFQHPTRDLLRGYFFARLARIYHLSSSDSDCGFDRWLPKGFDFRSTSADGADLEF